MQGPLLRELLKRVEVLLSVSKVAEQHNGEVIKLT